MDEYSHERASARPRRGVLRMALFVVVALGMAAVLAAGPFSGQPRPAVGASSTNPIQHVVVIVEENHSFDNVLGKFCQEVANGQIARPGSDSHCNGATTGTMSNGTVTPLVSASDIVTASTHSVQAQQDDIDGGKMNGFNVITPCNTSPASCYSQYDPLSGPCPDKTCIPNLSTLATDYTVSDATFELDQSPSWEGHMYLVTATQDGFLGNNPNYNPAGPTPLSRDGGWGCDSGAVTLWVTPAHHRVLIPSCIPNASGSLGPNWVGYTGLKAPYVPTIFDDLDAHGLTWKIYGGAGAPSGTAVFQRSGWQWAICPTFAECLYSQQKNNLVPASNIVNDASAGRLPTFSIVTPTAQNSEHNAYSMSMGDDYIGHMISAIQAGPEWSSTAVFVTYDDCGCFYDHVNPLQYNPQWGIRVPMVIVSPYAKAGYTDSQPTTFAGILAFVEHTFGLAPLNATDRSAYNYLNAFCFPTSTGCTPAGLTRVKMITQPVPPPTRAQVAAQVAAAQEDT